MRFPASSSPSAADSATRGEGLVSTGSSRRRLLVAVVLASAMAACILGWVSFWFLTDDAFIAFRYVGNRQLGHGYCWNPPPFLPVEGYTSFLWIVMLDFVWMVTGLTPPQSANVISLLASLGTICCVSALTARVVRACSRSEWLPGSLALVLAATVGSRTFLVWTSSGLETSLFNLLVHVWVLTAFSARSEAPDAAYRLVGWAAVISLARPDGLLFLAVSILATLVVAGRSRRLPTPWQILALSPVLLVMAHLAWRRIYYGDWLPNTWVAKVVSPWPEAGLRFLGSFALENGSWLWLLLLVVGLAVNPPRFRSVPASVTVVRAAVVTGLMGQVAYYVLRVGGDHFEYRVLSHLVPLLPVTLLWVLLRSGAPQRRVSFALTAFLAASVVLPWTHESAVRRARSFGDVPAVVPVADHLMAPLRPLGWAFDRLQAWLIPRHIGVRHHQHRDLWMKLSRVYPSREVGYGLAFRQEIPIHAPGSVGVAGWSLPGVAIIDLFGLNDWVVARTPVRAQPVRMMAHERWPPAGYLDDFEPSLFLTEAGRLEERPRRRPLTLAAIPKLEALWRQRASYGELQPIVATDQLR